MTKYLLTKIYLNIEYKSLEVKKSDESLFFDKLKSAFQIKIGLCYNEYCNEQNMNTFNKIQKKFIKRQRLFTRVCPGM